MRYVVITTNTGTVDETGVVFQDAPDANTSLVAGSVSTDTGSVTTGNTPGDAAVVVAIGTIPAGRHGDPRLRRPHRQPARPGCGSGRQPGNGFPRTRCRTSRPTIRTPQTDDDPTPTPLGPMAALEATKRDQLLTDADSSTSVTPGDTLRYTVVLTSVGTGGALDVVFTDAPGTNTMLVSGSVSTTSGTIAAGNGAGDSTIQVDIASMPVGDMATITFDVTINSVLVPPSAVTVGNQGLVNGSNAPDEPTDDPDTPSDDDPTMTPLGNGPALDALKQDSLITDADFSGGLTAGDTLEYQVVISNLGASDATSVLFDDGPMAKRPAGRRLGDDHSRIRGLSATQRATRPSGFRSVPSPLAKRLLSRSRSYSTPPLPAPVTEIVNQGAVASDQLPDVPTDDPDTVAGDDPTRTPISGTPALDSTKQEFLLTDLDQDGVLSPGDTLRYVITVSNTSDTVATGVRVNDTPDPIVQLINGSVSASQGLVLTGNTAGDASIVANLGALGGSQQATVTYDVLIPTSPTRRHDDDREPGCSQNRIRVPDVPTDDPITPHS